MTASIKFLTLVFLLSITASASAESSRTMRFVNDSGVDVAGLHIQFVQAVTPIVDGHQDGVEFKVASAGDAVTYTFDSLTNGDDVYVTVISPHSRIEMAHWWWEVNDQRVGVIQSGGPSAVVEFDQEFVPAGSTATVSAHVTAEQSANALLVVTYEVLNASGGVLVPATSLIAVVPAGQEQVRQPETLQLNKAGTYTVSYEVEDMVTLVILDSGSSTLTVDDDGFRVVP